MKPFALVLAIAALSPVPNVSPPSIPVNEVAAVQKWALLGERTVTDRVDHDTLKVTAARGDFRRIKFTVKGSPIRIYRLVVRYGNGEPDNIEVRELIPDGGESRAIDLRGGDRVIKTIDFWYETKSIGKQSALVQVFGLR